jgi:hypothetical protein
MDDGGQVERYVALATEHELLPRLDFLPCGERKGVRGPRWIVSHALPTARQFPRGARS